MSLRREVARLVPIDMAVRKGQVDGAPEQHRYEFVSFKGGELAVISPLGTQYTIYDVDEADYLRVFPDGETDASPLVIDPLFRSKRYVRT